MNYGQQLLQKDSDLWGVDDFGINLKVEGPPAESRDQRLVLPAAAKEQNRRLPS